MTIHDPRCTGCPRCSELALAILRNPTNPILSDAMANPRLRRIAEEALRTVEAGYEPPDPYAPRALEMTAEERESLGAFADGVATMRGASNALVMSSEEREQLGAFADGVEAMRSAR